jgi:hypothetical protein
MNSSSVDICAMYLPDLPPSLRVRRTTMRTLILATLALAGCGQPQAEVAAAPTENEAPPVAAALSAGIDGWEIDQTAYTRNSSALPALAGKKADGSEFTSESLRGRWTILGLWSGPAPANEASFTAALSAAADQDPDLDVLVIHATGAMPQPAPAWPTLEDTGTLISTLAPRATPAYLLIGPDLTIEGYRGALSATPDDGIKSVIRGVAEIRKQIAAPQ